jgi:hypothetical protein
MLLCEVVDVVGWDCDHHAVRTRRGYAQVDLPEQADTDDVRLSLDDEYDFGSDDGGNDSYHDDVDGLSDGEPGSLSDDDDKSVHEPSRPR